MKGRPCCELQQTILYVLRYVSKTPFFNTTSLIPSILYRKRECGANKGFGRRTENTFIRRYTNTYVHHSVILTPEGRHLLHVTQHRVGRVPSCSVPFMSCTNEPDAPNIFVVFLALTD